MAEKPKPPGALRLSDVQSLLSQPGVPSPTAPTTPQPRLTPAPTPGIPKLVPSKPVPIGGGPILSKIKTKEKTRSTEKYDPYKTTFLPQFGENAKEFGAIMKGAPQGLVGFGYGLVKDTLETSVAGLSNLVPGWEFDASTETIDEMKNSFGRTFAVWKRIPEYKKAIDEGRPITAMLIEDAGNLSVLGFGLRALAKGAANYSATAAAAGRQGAASRAASFATGAEKAGQRVVRFSDFVGAAPFKPYVWAYTKAGAGLKSGFYHPALGGWGEAAAEGYNKRINDLFEAEPDIRLDDPRLEDLRRKVEKSGRLSIAGQARKAIRRSLRQKFYEPSLVKKQLLYEIKNAEYANEINPDTGKVWGPLSADEHAVVIAVLNGRAQLVSRMVDDVNLPPEELAYLGRYDMNPELSLTPTAARLADSFIRNEVSPQQYDRLSKAIDGLAKQVIQFTQRAAAGQGRTKPLQPDYLYPEPIPEYLERRIVASKNPRLMEEWEIIKESEVMKLPPDDPARINAMQGYMASLPNEILLDPSIYPPKERENVEFYNRVRRALEDRLWREVTGEPGGPPGQPPIGPDGRPMPPKVRRPGAGKGLLESTKSKIEKTKEIIEKVKDRIAKEEEAWFRANDKIIRGDIVRYHIDGMDVNQIARRTKLKPDVVRDIIARHPVAKAWRNMNLAKARLDEILAVLGDDIVNKTPEELTLEQQRLLEEAAELRRLADEAEQQLNDAVAENEAIIEENGRIQEQIADNLDELESELIVREAEYEQAGGDPDLLDEEFVDLDAPPSQPMSDTIEAFAQAMAEDPTLYEYFRDTIDEMVAAAEEFAGRTVDEAPAWFEEDFPELAGMTVEVAQAVLARADYILSGKPDTTLRLAALDKFEEAATTAEQALDRLAATDKLVEEKRGLLKTVEELQARRDELVAAEKAQAVRETTPPTVTIDTLNSALDTVDLPTKTRDSLRRAVENAGEYVAPTPKESAKLVRRRVLDLLKAVAGGRGLMIQSFGGNKWWTDGYVIARADDIDIAQGLEDGQYSTSATKDADIKPETLVRSGGAPRFTSLIDQAKKIAKQRITLHYRVGDLVVGSLADGTLIAFTNENLAAFGGGPIELFGDTPTSGVLVKRGKEVLGMVMPNGVIQSFSDWTTDVPSESQIIDAITLSPTMLLDVNVSELAESTIRSKLRQSLGFDSEYGKPYVTKVSYQKAPETSADVDKRLSAANERLKAIDNELLQESFRANERVQAARMERPEKAPDATALLNSRTYALGEVFGKGADLTKKTINSLYRVFADPSALPDSPTLTTMGPVSKVNATISVLVRWAKAVADAKNDKAKIELILNPPDFVPKELSDRFLRGVSRKNLESIPTDKPNHPVTKFKTKMAEYMRALEAEVQYVRAYDEVYGPTTRADWETLPDARLQTYSKPNGGTGTVVHIYPGGIFFEGVSPRISFQPDTPVEAVLDGLRALRVAIENDAKAQGNRRLAEFNDVIATLATEHGARPVDGEFLTKKESKSKAKVLAAIDDTIARVEAMERIDAAEYVVEPGSKDDYTTGVEVGAVTPEGTRLAGPKPTVEKKMAAVKPDPTIANPVLRDLAYSDELLTAMAEEQSAALKRAETAEARFAALEDYAAAAGRYKTLYDKFMAGQARLSRLTEQQARRVERLSKLRLETLPALKKVARESQRVVNAIENSETYARLQNLSTFKPYDLSRDAGVAFGPEFDVVARMPEGEIAPFSAVGPMYVPTGGFEKTYGGLRTEIVREGLVGWTKLPSEYYRTGIKQTIFDIRQLAVRMGEELQMMTANEAYRAVVQQFSSTASKILGKDLVQQLWDRALEQALALAPEQAEALAIDVQRVLDEELGGVMDEGIAAYAEGLRAPERAYMYAARQLYGDMIARHMQIRGYTPVNPFAPIDRPMGVSAITTPPVSTVMDETLFMPVNVKQAIAQGRAVIDPNAWSKFERGMFKVTSAMKTTTLVLSVSWQLGDLITSIVIAQMTGIPVKDMIRRMRQVAREEYGGSFSAMTRPSVDLPTATPVIRLAQEAPVQDISLAMAERAELRGVRPMEEKPVGLPRRATRTVVNTSFKINETINRIGRHAYFLELLSRKLEAKFALEGRPVSADEALRIVAEEGSWRLDPEMRELIFDVADTANKWLGDFANLTIAERRFVTPLVPFYSWIKHVHHVFLMLGDEHPQSIRWYAFIGSLAYDPEEDPMNLQQGGVRMFGGVVSTNIFNPLGDVFDGPLVGTLTHRDVRKLLNPLGPAPRLLSAAAGFDIANIRAVPRPPGYGVYSETGLPLASSYLPGLGGGVGETLGMVASQFPIATRLLNVLPSGTIPGTNIATGPYQRYLYGEARVDPRTRERLELAGGRIAAAGRLFSLPGIPWRTEEQMQDIARSARSRLQTLEVIQRRNEILGPP